MPCSSHHRQRANTARSRGCRCGRSQDAGSFAPCKVALVPKLLGNCRRGTVWGLSESRICLHVHVWAHRKTAQGDPWSPDREISDKAPCNPPGFTAGLWDPAACFSSREELSESGHPYFHPRPALWSPLNHFFLYFISCTRHSRDTRLPFSSGKHRAPSRKPNLGGTAIAASFTNAVLRQTIVKGKNQCKNTKQSENAKSLSVPQSHITSQPKAGRSRDASSRQIAVPAAQKAACAPGWVTIDYHNSAPCVHADPGQTLQGSSGKHSTVCKCQEHAKFAKHQNENQTPLRAIAPRVADAGTAEHEAWPGRSELLVHRSE